MHHALFIDVTKLTNKYYGDYDGYKAPRSGWVISILTVLISQWPARRMGRKS